MEALFEKMEAPFGKIEAPFEKIEAPFGKIKCCAFLLSSITYSYSTTKPVKFIYTITYNVFVETFLGVEGARGAGHFC